MRTNRRQFLRILPVAALLLSGGCAPLFSQVMISAPNRWVPFMGGASASPPVRQAMGVDQQFLVSVGMPNAELAVSIMEPEHGTPRGTVLVLHGIWARSFWMNGTARMLADHGFRAVLVDLRGHGRSTGRLVTFGQQESRDLVQVIDELERRRLIAGPLGVYGISFGAATAIQLAGRDPRIAAVVAVAPFSRMRDVVPDYARTVLPGIEAFLSDELFREAVDGAGDLATFDPDESDAVVAIERTHAPVLILHGMDDWLVPPYHALRLYEAAPDRSELVFLPHTGHTSIWFDPTGDVADHTRRWFERWLTAGKASVVTAAE